MTQDIGGKRILVTGGGGFIGSHLTHRLVEAGADVAILTKYESVIDNVRLASIWDRIRPIEGDLRNLDSLLGLADFAPQIVFHLAAYNHVGGSFRHYSEALECNGNGTANLLNAYDGYERFVYISSSEVYGAQDSVPFIETMTPQPVSPYAIGKYTGELYCRMAMSEMGRPITVLRPFNAFGPYQSSRAVIAEIIATCLANAPVQATEGTQTREFNFVENLVDGMLLGATTEAALGQIINLGAAEEFSIRNVIETIHDATGSSSELAFGALPARPTEIPRMKCDNTRATEILGWTPRRNFREGLELTIDWFRAYQEIFNGDGSPLTRLSPAGYVNR